MKLIKKNDYGYETAFCEASGYQQRFQKSGSLKDKPRSRRTRCSTARDDRFLLRLCRTDRKKTAPKLKRQWSE